MIQKIEIIMLYLTYFINKINYFIKYSKQMPIDINIIRTNPELVRESEKKRFKTGEVVDVIIELDNQWRFITGSIDNLRRDKNTLQKEIAKFYKNKNKNKAEPEQAEAEAKAKAEQAEPEQLNLDQLLDQMKDLDIHIALRENERTIMANEIKSLLNTIGNIVANDVIVSNNEDDDNQIVKEWGDVSLYNPITNPDKYKFNHHVLLRKIGGFEPERGAKIAGHKGYFLKDCGLQLNQALINYSLAFLKERSFTLLQPPYFMKKDVMAGVAQLEEFNETLYHVGNASSTPDGTEESYLIATSEQPICAYHQGEVIEMHDLPKRYAGYSPCFRKEAGKHGKDTWGIFRVHQFDKIEQFIITSDDYGISDNWQNMLLSNAEVFYQSLGIPYRVVNIVSGSLNNAAIRKYDLEGWFPGYNAYRELVSCSNCTDYQSRAMNIRLGHKTDRNDEKHYVHMLNSTLCACTRVICCLLELGQTDTGVKLPEVLKPYMGGIDFLPFVQE